MVQQVNDRRRNAYQNATALTQAMLDETFRGGENQIETIGVLTKTVGATTYTIRFADRPKYVGDVFYEGRANFPTIKRTIGELQAPSIQFSEFEVVLGNMDGFYNNYLEGGSDYISFLGARLQILIGLRDVLSSFITVFDGFVPEQDGFTVERETISIRANDRFDRLNKGSGLPYINGTDFPSAPADSIGKIIPLILGDWETGYNITANAAAVSIQNAGTSYDVQVDSPNGFYAGAIGYFVGGGSFVFSIGTYTPESATLVHIKRADALMKANFVAVPVSTAGYWSIGVTSLQKVGGGNVPYLYQNGDVAVIKIKVPYAASKYSNPIEIAEQVLFTLGGFTATDLDTASWSALKTKSTPAQSNMAGVKCRIWIGDEKDTILGIVLGILEQVRVEMFVNLAGKIQLRSLHLDEFISPDSMPRIEQCEMDESSIRIKADERSFFNQAWMNYAYSPATGKTELSTIQMKNPNSISKSGKATIKIIDSPWLYVESDANLQLTEYIRFYSAGLTFVEVDVAWVHLLRELGNFISFNYAIGSLNYNNKPMQIRDIAIDPATGGVSLKLLSFANLYYAAYMPANYTRFLSGDSETINSV